MDKEFVIFAFSSIFSDPLQIFTFHDLDSALSVFDSIQNTFKLKLDYCGLFEHIGHCSFKLGEKS